MNDDQFEIIMNQNQEIIQILKDIRLKLSVQVFEKPEKKDSLTRKNKNRGYWPEIEAAFKKKYPFS